MGNTADFESAVPGSSPGPGALSPHGISIRHATPADADAVAQLLRRFFAEEGFTAVPSVIEARVAEFLRRDTGAAFLAHDEGEVVGVATATTTFGIEFGWCAEIEDLYVRPEARGRGVARTLVEAANAWCVERGCSAVAVIVTAAGEAAHSLVDYYARLGFTDTGRRVLLREL